ncbi:MAG: hypothetical protein KJO07_24255 [Deltaproteobacteria bacterium]|jgi:hypothetical protein|nr:hypothetical protein [Deltaproteobacteria bacterium]
MGKIERRSRRSRNTSEALYLQLDACREDSKLEAIVLSDEDGLCLAAAGERDTCDEIAANLPFVGAKAPNFEGVLFSPTKAWKVGVRRFEVLGTELYLCVAGGRDDNRDRELSRSLGGVARILGQDPQFGLAA